MGLAVFAAFTPGLSVRTVELLGFFALSIFIALAWAHNEPRL